MTGNCIGALYRGGMVRQMSSPWIGRKTPLAAFAGAIAPPLARIGEGADPLAGLRRMNRMCARNNKLRAAARSSNVPLRWKQ
jgi:hypothetical protein